MNTLVTHNGIFHADEIFAIAALRAAGYKFEILRSRDPKVIGAADIVVDVGGIYDPDSMRFDHHHFHDGDQNYGRSAFGLVAEYLWGSDFDNEVMADLVKVVDARDTRVDYDPSNTWDQYLGYLGDLNALDIQGIDQEMAFSKALNFAEKIIRAIQAREIFSPEAGKIFDELEAAAAASRSEKEKIFEGRAKAAKPLKVGNWDFVEIEGFVGLKDIQAHHEGVCGSIFHDPQTSEVKVTVDTDHLVITKKSKGAKFVHANGFFAVWSKEDWDLDNLILEGV